MAYDQEENFDFQTVDEQKEELDFQNLKPCPHCQKLVPKNAISCLYCGESISFSARPKWVMWVVIFVIVSFILLIIF